LAEARANGFTPPSEGPKPASGPPRRASLRQLAARGPRSAVRLDPILRAWELAGNYPAILDDDIVGESARGLFADAQAMLDKIVSEKWLTARATVGLWPVEREGDDIVVLDKQRTRLPFLRQQVKKRAGRPNMCLADSSHRSRRIGSAASPLRSTASNRTSSASRPRTTIITTSC
jgi:5-methyltetrahydrofolate--homocysteine methyltransferase